METIQVIYKTNKILLVLGEKGIELSRAEAEKLFIDLGHALQDQDVVNAHKQRAELGKERDEL